MAASPKVMTANLENDVPQKKTACITPGGVVRPDDTNGQV
jgi:hypothetical protein